MNDNVMTTLDIPVERVLDNARHLTEVVLCGFDDQGEFYLAANKTSGASALWLLALAQKKLLEIGDNS